MLEDPIRWIKNVGKPREFLEWVRERANPRMFLRRGKYRGLQSVYRVFHPEPIFVADMTWDNLIVLDACRFDAFAQLNGISGKLTKIISAGSHTLEWLRNNFSDRNMKHIVYISANPYASYYHLHKMLGKTPFYKIMEVWKDGWNEELGTVHPSTINEETSKSLVLHPDKRHLIHYMQPHEPFIGNVKVEKKKMSVWNMLREGLITADAVWRCYISNLRLVLRYVKDLLPTLPGRTCITSDHGNTFGRLGFFGHPQMTPLPELIEVPWLEVSS